MVKSTTSVCHVFLFAAWPWGLAANPPFPQHLEPPNPRFRVQGSFGLGLRGLGFRGLGV